MAKIASINVLDLDKLLKDRLDSDGFRAEIPTLAAMSKLTLVDYPLPRRNPLHLVEVAGALRLVTGEDYYIDAISVSSEHGLTGGSADARRRAFQDFLLHAVDDWSRSIIERKIKARTWNNQLDLDTQNLLTSFLIGWAVMALDHIVSRADKKDPRFWQRTGDPLLDRLKFALGYPYFVYYSSLITGDKIMSQRFRPLCRLLPYCLPCGTYEEDGQQRAMLTIIL